MKSFRYVDSIFTDEAHLLINQGKITTLEQLNIYFHSWMESYNNRVHRTTKQTPKHRFEASSESIRHMTAEELQTLFLWGEERSVRKTSVVEIEGNVYDVDTSLKGKKIQVRYNPFDLSMIQIWNDVRYEDARSAELRSQKHSKLPADQEEAQTTAIGSNYLERLKAEQEAKKRKELGTTSFAKLKEKKKRGDLPC
ncbi:hypothetical protein Back11_39150 [Paenibacillus baekrokdamisoli]|uniref:Uncharacterized protein n=1 Tax=Paenibacillus baekrokdamisoli TaxID=1712516 RepID=A0A3G9IUU5_9BACL|nr:Mu transposase C-terminal domain-containing protein [Paenibacillus baekrokdamisoli]MBB3068385.1 hypothetical protein [Paenibacillus baekrokdamisoli]BBH22570.1 hypothetical protein Back11_39150 [Paenibacillus baekrokdamisoli]